MLNVTVATLKKGEGDLELFGGTNMHQTLASAVRPLTAFPRFMPFPISVFHFRPISASISAFIPTFISGPFPLPFPLPCPQSFPVHFRMSRRISPFICPFPESFRSISGSLPILAKISPTFHPYQRLKPNRNAVGNKSYIATF